MYQSKDEGRGVPGQEEGPSVDDDSQGSSCIWKISLIEKYKTYYLLQKERERDNQDNVFKDC